MREYARIETDCLAAEHLVRFSVEPNKWALNTRDEPHESLVFGAIGVRISLAAIYEGIEFRDESTIAFLCELSH